MLEFPHMASASPIPQNVVSLTDYEPLARERVEKSAWEYIAGGAAEEITLRDNRAAYDRLKILPRMLADMTGGNTRIDLLGRTWESPVFLAPVAYQKLAHADGELATALGAAAMKTGMVLSTQAGVSVEDFGRGAQTPWWFQLYIQPDRGFTRDLVQRAEAAGAEALMVTVDAPVHLRNREQRARFHIPPEAAPVNLRGLAPVQPGPEQDAGNLVFNPANLALAVTWRDVEWLLSFAKRPVLLKGILSADDAEQAVKLGVAGIVVSNHGGRTLDTVPASIDALPRIADRLAGAKPILLDGGIRRGTDVFKALALGASAVMIGRPYFWGLAAAGAVGVAHVLRILRAELETTMVLAGCPTISRITKNAIWRE
jgi:4-hydroxymandelate oxidase